MAEPLRRPMTEAERQMARALGRCSFAPGTFDKRWAQAIAFVVTTEDPTITPKEAAILRAMVQRYRRQIGPAIVMLADDPGPDEFTPAPSLQLEIL